MRGIVTIPRLRRSASWPAVNSSLGLGDAYAGVAERGGQLADLAGRAGLDRVVDLPRVTAGRTDQFGNTQMDQLRIVRHPRRCRPRIVFWCFRVWNQPDDVFAFVADVGQRLMVVPHPADLADAVLAESLME